MVTPRLLASAREAAPARKAAAGDAAAMSFE
jgi:hypothetical protein